MLHLILLFIIYFVNGDKVIQTNSGPVMGISLDPKNVEAFLGIPYAEPPTGDLRFAKPVPKSPWKETFNANELPPACVQAKLEHLRKAFNLSIEMNEDCLYLNLWVPKTESSSLKPVMIFIHGGTFMTGSSNIKYYDGAKLAEYGDVIVASMNYRIGTLGFFSAFTEEAAGSMGMYDQVLAIQWIKENAKYFGGDSDNIVLFGSSAGATSVSMHMVSPLSKNLFKRAILQSGSSINLMFSDDNTVLRMGSQAISMIVGCAADNEEYGKNPNGVVECMKNLPPEKFAEADSVLFQKLGMLLPRVGDEFLPMNPVDLYRKGEFKDSEVLLGVTGNEGSLFVTMFVLGSKTDDPFGKTIDPYAFNETFAKEMVRSFANDKIIENYFKKVKEESRYSYLMAVSDIIGDALITCGTMFQADFQSLKSHPVYFYLFDYRPSSSRLPEWLGAPHGSEAEYVFGIPQLAIFTEYDEDMNKDLMDMWVAFAKTGNPSTPGSLKWPKYAHESPNYLIIGKTDKLGVKPDNYRCELWRDIYRSTIDT